MNTKIDAVAVLPIPTWEDRVYQAHPRSEAEHWPDKLKIGCMELEIADLREHIAAAERAAAAAKDGEQAGDVIADLAMLVRRLVRRLEKDIPGTDLAPQAIDFLKRKGLLGSPLREEATAAPSGSIGELPPLSPTLRNTYSSLTERSHEKLVKEYGQACVTADRAARTPPTGIDASPVPAPQVGHSEAVGVVVPEPYKLPFRRETDKHEVVTIWDADNCGLPFELNTHTQRSLDDKEGLAQEREDAEGLADFIVEAMNAYAAPSPQGAENNNEGGK